MTGSRAVVVVAVVLVLYVVSIIRLTDASPRGVRHAVPGELIVVQLRGSWDWMRSTDESVVRPISISLKPGATGYFVAVRPGRAFLQALNDPCPITMVHRCMAPAEIFAAEIDVWPG